MPSFGATLTLAGNPPKQLLLVLPLSFLLAESGRQRRIWVEFLCNMVMSMWLRLPWEQTLLRRFVPCEKLNPIPDLQLSFVIVLV